MVRKRFVRNIKKILSLTMTMALALPLVYASDISIGEYAGKGEAGYKDGISMEATFSSPYGLATTNDGGILVTDSDNNLIREIKGGSVSTIAGSVDGFDDFGLPLTGYYDSDKLKAKFNHPIGIAVDSKGIIFISDSGNNVVRMLKDDKVYTFSGNSKEGYMDGNKKDSQFDNPTGIAIDKDDNVYVADTLNNVIRKISPKGDTTTFAGKKGGGYKDGDASEALFNEPSGIAFDQKSNLYVLDSGNQLLRMISAGKVTTVCGVRDNLMEGTNYYKGAFADGDKNTARFNFPKGLYVTSNNIILISDTYNHRIRAVDENGNTVTIAGTGETGRISGEPKDAQFNNPTGLLVKDGKLYIADTLNNCIRVMKASFDKLPQTIDNGQADKALDPLVGIKLSKTKELQVWLNKKTIDFKDAKPYIKDGKTMVPIRAVCEAWGAKVLYDQKTGGITISKGGFQKTFVKADVRNLLEFKNKSNYIYINQLAEILSLNVDVFDKYNAIILTAR